MRSAGAPAARRSRQSPGLRSEPGTTRRFNARCRRGHRLRLGHQADRGPGTRPGESGRRVRRSRFEMRLLRAGRAAACRDARPWRRSRNGGDAAHRRRTFAARGRRRRIERAVAAGAAPIRDARPAECAQTGPAVSGTGLTQSHPLVTVKVARRLAMRPSPAARDRGGGERHGHDFSGQTRHFGVMPVRGRSAGA